MIKATWSPKCWVQVTSRVVIDVNDGVNILTDDKVQHFRCKTAARKTAANLTRQL